MCKKIFSTILLIFLLCIFINSNQTDLNVNKEDIDIYLSIEKIDINESLNIISKQEGVNGIVLYEEYGKPNIKNTNTVIAAHSGYGPNAYFNDIVLLEKGDKINIKYNNIQYEYEVEKVIEVKDTEVRILDNRGYSSLSLITCKMGDSEKRVIVEAKML